MSMKQEWQALVLSKESDFPFFLSPFFFFLNLQHYYEHLENKFFPND